MTHGPEGPFGESFSKFFSFELKPPLSASGFKLPGREPNNC